MPRTPSLDRVGLLHRLDPVRFEENKHEDRESLKQFSLGDSLLQLAQLTSSNEHELCRGLAVHLLGSVREPEDVDEVGEQEV
jgi:hypothetical protein